MEDNKQENVISPGSVSHSFTICDEWKRKMTTEIKGETGGNYQKEGLKVPRVPSTFRKIEKNKNCYDPSVVSLGPYHHGKQELKEMEELKFPMARQFVKDCGISFEGMWSKVIELNIDASKCYEEDIIAKFNKDDQFAQMMFLDGCFILQFLICFMLKPEKLKMSSHDAGLITKDLFLLENQLPFSVLKSLMSLRYGTSDYGGEGMGLFEHFFKLIRAIPPRRESCRDKISEYFVKLVPKSPSGSSGLSGGDQVEPAHLLEFFHMKFAGHQASPRDETSRQEEDSRTKCMRIPIDTRSSIYRYHPAMELKRVGIHFKPSKTNLFIDVQFKPSLPTGKLKIPPLLINDSTESLLLNLVAYEAYASRVVVTSYICFMDSLIDHAEDVKVLRSRGIIINKFGNDQQVADLFNGIAKHLVPDPSVYATVKREIESECSKVVNKWMAEWRGVYFRSPWAFIAVLAAIFTIALTAIQTYITVIQFLQPPKDRW